MNRFLYPILLVVSCALSAQPSLAGDETSNSLKICAETSSVPVDSRTPLFVAAVTRAMNDGALDARTSAWVEETFFVGKADDGNQLQRNICEFSDAEIAAMISKAKDYALDPSMFGAYWTSYRKSL